MDDNQYRDEFEEFLQEQTNNFRMYPSDGIWRNIDKVLHGQKKWPALTIATFILLISAVAISVYFTPKPNIFAIQPFPTKRVEVGPINQNDPTPASPFLKSPTVKTYQASSYATTSTTAIIEGIGATPNQLDLRKDLIGVGLQNLEKAKEPHYDGIGNSIEVIKSENEPTTLVSPNIDLTTLKTSAISAGNINNTTVKSNRKQNNNSKAFTVGDYDDRNVVDDYLKQQKDGIQPSNTGSKIFKNRRFSYHLYATPSTSYRRLREDRSINTAEGKAEGPIALNYIADVNKIVRHKPGTGLETGIGILYNLSNKLRVKTGLQLNMRQYSIEAYRTNTEVATIALITSSGLDSLSTLSVFRTTTGYKDQKLINRYYQLSVPVGLEWEVLGNKKVQINVAGTLQPTYLLNKDAYLLTTNLKNYTEKPDVFRNWNLNTSMETFLSYKVGDFKWQIGPQVRYQYLSTFIDEYPIKEHLLDYGLKIGFTKTFR